MQKPACTRINQLDAKIKRQMEAAEKTRSAAESKADASARLLKHEVVEIQRESEQKEEPLNLQKHRSA